MSSAGKRPKPAEAVLYALRLGCLSFGGPAGQIALVSREVVDERRWLDAADFSRALQLAMLLPGPEALQAVIYVGWLLFGTVGAVVAGSAFLVPGALLLIVLSWGYVRFGSIAAVAAGLTGLKAVVLALIVTAVLTLGRRMLRSRLDVFIAVLSTALVLLVRLPSPASLAIGAALALFGRDPEPVVLASFPPRSDRIRRLTRVLSIGLLLWWIPLWVARQLQLNAIAEQIYVELSRVALGGFGGAYAVVSWVGQLFVQHHHWIGEADLTAGIGLSETTPGPLLLVLQFYGFVAGWFASGDTGSLLMAISCAVLASWATFLPSFVLVIALAPEVATLAGRPLIGKALHGVGAAVVGIIATFASVVAKAVLLPDGRVDHTALLIAAVAALLLGRRWLSLLATMGLGIAAALVLH